MAFTLMSLTLTVSIIVALPDEPLFDCGDGDVIDRSLVCDHYADCLDASDETGCPSWRTYYQGHCMDGWFDCGLSNTCVQDIVVCDGKYDCETLMDETACVFGLSIKERALIEEHRRGQERIDRKKKRLEGTALHYDVITIDVTEPSGENATTNDAVTNVNEDLHALATILVRSLSE